MLGAYICPHCDTHNACNCLTCEPWIKPEDIPVGFTEDGEALICGNCKKIFTHDQALDKAYADWQKLTTPPTE